jgi:hypothetical protein
MDGLGSLRLTFLIMIDDSQVVAMCGLISRILAGSVTYIICTEKLFTCYRLEKKA